MNSMGVRATVAVLLLFIATVKAVEEGGVTFWREEFTMTCPGTGKWMKKEDTLADGKTYTQPYNTKSKGLYRCEYTKSDENDLKKYYFYVKGKVCENCFELDSFVVGLAIVVDVLGTAFVMMVIYRYTKKKYSAGLSQASKAPARSAGRHQGSSAPPAPPADYEPLNPRTRAQDPYDVVNRNG